MEIMHSKLVKLQTVLMLLALLFTVLLPSPVHAVDDAPAAQAVTEYEAISDPNTTGIWYKTQGFNTSTVGRIWADKTVATDKIEFQNGPLAEKKESIDKPDDGSDFLIALSTMSSVLSSSTTTTNALDIVLVLDASGSMDDPMGNGDSAKRINALKQAINGFDSHGEHTDGVLDMIAAQNEKLASDKKIQVAIVKYAGNKTDRIGNDTYQNGQFTYNYTQTMKDLTECTSGSNLRNLKNTVNNIKPAGATRSDYAMSKASDVITNAKRNSKKVVIFFTDGTPTSFSNFDSGVANSAVSTAKDLKDKGTKIYTVGIFSGADAETVPTYEYNYGHGRWNLSAENLFMNAVSSNYPNADAYSSLGTRAEDADYYKAASNSTELKDAFNAIINSTLQEPPSAPTEIKGDNPAKTGYVTFNDTLGDYMEVKNFNAIVFADQIFRASDDSPTIKRSNQGNKTTITYTFTNEITGGNVAYPNKANLADVIITVTHYNNDYQHGDDVKVDIPITMLPLRNYQLTTVDDVTQMAISPTYPISVFYSVGLKDNVREVLSGNVTADTTALATSLSNYMAEKKMTGAVDFFANAYSGTHSSTATDPDVTIGDATASFTPATSNNYYYYTKDTPIYMDKACTQPVKEFHFDTEYYYKVDYYEIDGKNADALAGKSVPAKEGSNVVQIKVASGSDVLDTNKIFLNKSDNCYYIAEGTKKGSLPQAVDEQLGPKEKNLTETASRRIDFGWDSNYTTGMLYLGNNGKLTLDAVGDLKITKKVNTSDASYTPDTDNLGFSIQVTLTGKGADGKYTYLVGGETKEFKSDDIITLQKDQTAEIKGLPAGCSYTVVEVNPPAGYTPSYTNGSGTIEACKTKDATVTNTYTPAPYENKPGNADYLFQAVKQLDGRPWAEGDAFTIVLTPAKGSPAPASTEHVVDKATDNGTPFDFGTITFDKPGTYTYTIYEKAPAQRLPGIDYDTTSYTATVVVKDNGHGQLELDKENSKIELNPNSDGNVAEMPENGIPLFLNIFDAKDEVVNFKASKNYVDNFGSEISLNGNEFQFILSAAETDAAGNPVTATTPLPTNIKAGNSKTGQVTFDRITYTEADIGKTYWYKISEEKTQEGQQNSNIAYDSNEYLIEVSVDYEGQGEDAIIKSTTTYYKQDADKNWQSVDAKDVIFTNILTPTPAYASLNVGKILEGRSWMDGDAFTFTLTPEKAENPMPEGENADKLVITNDSSHVEKNERLGSFGEICFKQPGTYKYTISEDAINAKELPGFKNLPGAITATVTVTRNGNELTCQVSYKNDDGHTSDVYGYFTNTYSAEPYKVSASELFKASKTLDGRGWQDDDQFTFVLTGDEANPSNTPMPSPVNCVATATIAQQTVTLGNTQELVFTTADTYTYYITETDDKIPGIFYDKTKYKVVVTVEDKGGNSAQLTGTVQYYKGTLGENGEYTFSDKAESSAIAAFINTYTTDPAVLDGAKNLSVTKKLVGRDWGKEEAFTFKIAVADGSDKDTPLPDPDTLTLTKPEGDTATSNFGDITYTKPGTYKYEITEVEGSNVISQWDKSIYTVIVKVEDNGTGELKIASSSVTKNDGDVDNGIYFENTYEPSPDPVKTVKDASGNSIDNTLVSPGQLLTYTIEWANTEVGPNGEPASAEITITDTVPVNTSLESIDNGGTEDENHKITWKIKAEPNQSGTVSFTVKVNENISGKDGAIDNSALVGNRTTNITHNYLPGKTVDKDANTSIKVGDELTYTIHYKNLEDAPADITVTDAVPTGTEFVSASDNGECQNNTVTWKLAGVEPNTDGIVSFKVRVTMDAVGKTIENQATVAIGDRAPAQTTKTETKTVDAPTPAIVTLAAHKTLISDVGNHPLAADEFAFTLLDKDGSIVQTVTNDDKGNVTFDELKLDTIGDYTYTICEVNGRLGYMTYDTSKYTVSFKVYDAQNGTLAATEPVYSLDGETVANAEFTNHYTAELPEDASFSLSATKTLTGRSMIDDEFVFTLEDEGGNIVATARNDAEGNIVFPKVGLKDVQEAYTALLAAAEPAQPVVEPTPVEDNEQPAQVEDSEQPDPTEDSERATPETAVAAYSLEDAPAVMTDPEPETDNKPTVDEGAVQKLLTRWYTIREYAQGKGGVTYDSNAYMVRVPLVDKDGTGTLTVDKDNIQFFAADGETPLDGNKIIFANSYAAQGVDLTVTAQKQLTGRGLADGEFSFRLSCDDDPTNEQTVTSDANGRITFTLHYDDKDGTGTQESHTYTVTEVRGDKETITYDDTAYTFTVDVTDDGEGRLTTKVTQPEAMIFRNVYTPKATSITLAGNKVLNGRAQKAGEFTFELCNANGAVISTAANGENGYFAFPALTYDEAGTYTYTVREKNTGASRVTYDTTVYSVTVQVRDEDGQLKADIILPASGLTFTNTYTPEPAPTPAPTPKPTTTPAPAATAAPTPAPVRIPQTADSFPLALLIGLLAVSGGVLAVLYTARKRGKK